MIEINNLTFQRENKIIIDDINCTINRGSFVGLIGPNGAGKSTLVELILGILSPTKGTIKINGINSQDLIKNNFFTGYVPQHETFDRRFPLNVFEVIRLGRYGKKKRFSNFSKSDNEVVKNVIELIGIKELMLKQIGELSGGELQRVLIARALSSEPELLILDEPDSSIDIMGQNAFFTILKEYQKEKNLTIIIVSHDIGMVAKNCDKIACLNKKLHFHDKPSLLDDKILVETYGNFMGIVLHDELPLKILDKHHV